MKKNYKMIIISIIILIFLLLGVVIFKWLGSKDETSTLKVNEVHSNYRVGDDLVMFLYDRYHPEDGLKFQVIGNNQSDYYGFYFRGEEVVFDDFPISLRNNIILDTINYQDKYDEENSCYLYSFEEFKDTYVKNFGRDDVSFDDDISLLDDQICIKDNQVESNYTKTLDTYFVNGFYQNDKIIIYEVVAFIKVNDKTIEFYQDYEMKNLVYKLDKKGVDMSFIHDSKKASNVLLKYQNKFSIYQYTYVKGKDTYYLESISK